MILDSGLLFWSPV